MSQVTYPDPRFLYQGASLTLSPLRLGPLVLCPARAYGINFAADAKLKIPDITLRPYGLRVNDDDPSTSQFTIFYTQYRDPDHPDSGVEWDMIFRLTCDQAGGVVGTEAALMVESNYPQIDMAIPRFKFTQGGFGIMKTGALPADYQATITVKFWDRGARVALDGWMMFEAGYYKDGLGKARAAKGAIDATQLVAVGRASLYPAHADNGGMVLGNAYRR